jgi:hypothetical protein
MNTKDNQIYSATIKVPAPIDVDVNSFISKQVRTATALIDAIPSKDTRLNLWKNMWFEGELCCLFADTNLGKSLLAVQIGNELATRFKRDVLYFDFEQSDQQFAMRYRDEQGVFNFSPHFYRIDFQQLKEDYEMVDVMRYVEALIVRHKSPFLIIDNITALCENASNAHCVTDFFENIKHLCRHYDLSTLVVAHTAAHSPYKPLSISDVACSRVFGNFCDSAFAIGHAVHAPGLLYIKHIKSRLAHIRLNTDNVIPARIRRIDHAVQLELSSTPSSEERLIDRMSPERYHIYQSACNLMAEGNSLHDIAEALGISKSSVQRIIHRYDVFRSIEESGIADDNQKEKQRRQKLEKPAEKPQNHPAPAPEPAAPVSEPASAIDEGSLGNSSRNADNSRKEKIVENHVSCENQPSQAPELKSVAQPQASPEVSHPSEQNCPNQPPVHHMDPTEKKLKKMLAKSSVVDNTRRRRRRA